MLSYSDLIQLGGYAAVEYAGGPSMVFRMGRVDAEESEVPKHTEGSGSVLDKAIAAGFSKKDFVALMGSHTIGFANLENSGT